MTDIHEGPTDEKMPCLNYELRTYRVASALLRVRGQHFLAGLIDKVRRDAGSPDDGYYGDGPRGDINLFEVGS